MKPILRPTNRTQRRTSSPSLVFIVALLVVVCSLQHRLDYGVVQAARPQPASSSSFWGGLVGRGKYDNQLEKQQKSPTTSISAAASTPWWGLGSAATNRGGATSSALAPSKKSGASTAKFRSPAASVKEYVSVSTLVWGGEDGRTQLPPGSLVFSPGCHLSSSKHGGFDWVGEGLWNTGKEAEGNAVALWKAVAFLSDIVVLVVEQRTPIDAKLVQALEAGFQARLKDLPKARLIIVLRSNNQRELAEWKTALEAEMSRAVPSILQDLNVVGVSEYRKSLAAMKKRVAADIAASAGTGGNGGVCNIADAETFPSLLKQIHRAFGGSKAELLNEVVGADSLVTESGIPSSSDFKSSGVGSGEGIVKPEDKEFETKLINMATEQFDDVQVQQEEIWLKAGKAKGGGPNMPINFASKVNPRLVAIHKALTKKSSKNGSSALPPSVEVSVRRYVMSRVQRLYVSQLDALREQYGKMYESTLEKMSNNKNAQAWKDAAERVTEKFCIAAENAVPTLCREGKAFDDVDFMNYHKALAESGLISDMMETTELKNDDVFLNEDDWVEETGVEEAGSSKRKKRKLTKWHERLAARMLVITINYLQGWLAWQGIKHAALMREQEMPKFPLF